MSSNSPDLGFRRIRRETCFHRIPKQQRGREDTAEGTEGEELATAQGQGDERGENEMETSLVSASRSHEDSGVRATAPHTNAHTAQAKTRNRNPHRPRLTPIKMLHTELSPLARGRAEASEQAPKSSAERAETTVAREAHRWSASPPFPIAVRNDSSSSKVRPTGELHGASRRQHDRARRSPAAAPTEGNPAASQHDGGGGGAHRS